MQGHKVERRGKEVKITKKAEKIQEKQDVSKSKKAVPSIKATKQRKKKVKAVNEETLVRWMTTFNTSRDQFMIIKEGGAPPYHIICHF